MRRGTFLFIHGFLILQIALPLSYYVGRDDPYDERFAWRMFSATRMVRCGAGPGGAGAPAFFVGDDPVPARLTEQFHTAWVGTAQRGRRSVIDAMAAELCRRNPGRPVRVAYSCVELDGETVEISTGERDECRARQP